MKQPSRSDNLIVVVFVLAALVASVQPLLTALKTTGGWPVGVYFPSYWLLTALALAAYAARRWGHFLIDRPVVWPLVIALVTVRCIYYSGRHWADLGWLLQYIGNVLTFGHQMGVTLLILAAYAVGSMIANNGVDHDLSVNYITSALPLLIAGTLICGLARIREAGVQSSVTAAVFLYVACAMVALALSQLELVRNRCRNTAGSRPVWQWIPVAALAVLAVLTVTAVLAAAIDPKVPGLITTPLRFVLELVASALDFILYPLAFAVAALYHAGSYLLSLLRREEVVWEPISGSAAGEVIKIEQLANLPFDLRWPLAAALLLLALFVLGQFLKSRPHITRRTVSDIDEQRLPITRGSNLQSAQPHSTPERMANDCLASQVALRQAYSHVLEWAAEYAVPRLPHLTVTQFNSHLLRLLTPEQMAALNELTTLYVPVRYGAVVPEPMTIARAHELAGTITSHPLTGHSDPASTDA